MAKIILPAIRVFLLLTAGFIFLPLALGKVTLHLSSDSEQCKSAGKQVALILQSFPPQDSAWDWYLICGEKRWQDVRMQYGNPQTRAVFTMSDWKQSYTFLNAEAVWPDALELRKGRTLRNVLAHELGHVICRCTDEDKADKAAAALASERPL